MGLVEETVPLLTREKKRYQIIYMWKMINGLAPKIEGVDGPNVVLLKSARMGKYFRLPKVNNRSAMSIQTMTDESLPINGARLFNSLPKTLEETLDTFKKRLDMYHRSVPDCRYLPHYHISVLSNSLSVIN